MTLFIDGGGFCSFWYCLGAAVARAAADTIECVSSGAIVAVLIVCMDKIDVFQILKVCIKSNVFFSVGEAVFAILDALLPVDAHHRANKRLGIVLCEPFTMSTYVVSHWDTREKLIHCVVASTHIPFVTSWSLLHPVYKCIDGCFVLDKSHYKTVISSPSYSNFEQFSFIPAARAIELFICGNKNNAYN